MMVAVVRDHVSLRDRSSDEIGPAVGVAAEYEERRADLGRA